MRSLLPGLAIVLALSSPATAQIVVQISEADCSRLVRHVAAPDTAYQPGVDVRGDPVTPADLDGAARIAVPDTIVFPLTLDLAERLGIPPGGDADYLAEPVIGEIEVTRDGRALFNGRPLTTSEQHELAQKCQRIDAQR